MDRKDPQTARYLRKRQQRDGQDNQQDDQDVNFLANPLKFANKHFKKKTQKNLQKQVQYFGHAIEPFNTQRDVDEDGHFDEEGHFQFSKRKRVRDAWLDSVNQAQDGEVADQIAKRIKTESRFQSVYEGARKDNEDLLEDEEEEEEEEQEQEEGEQGQEQQQKNNNEQSSNQKHGIMKADDDGNLAIQEMIQLMIQLIPSKGNANKYMKKLKQDKNMQEYEKLLTLSNLYIEKTGEYDILTKNRMQLQELLDEKREGMDEGGQEEEEVNWDQDDDDEGENDNDKKKEENNKQANHEINNDINNDNDDDDIF